MSPKTKEQFDEIRQKSKAVIKEVALELFANQGYHSTSISQIAKEANISKGLMYNYFNGKEALLKEIVADAVNIGEELMERMAASNEPPKEKLRTITEISFQMVQSNKRYWRLLTSMGLQPEIFTSLKEYLHTKAENGIKFGANLFEQLGFENPVHEALIYGAFMDGILLQYVTLSDLDFDYPIDEMKRFIFEKYGIE